MLNHIQQVMNPAWYHGHGKSAPFFEGWYFKLINATEDQRWAIIPGVFHNTDHSQSHAFIQVLDGMNGTATYHRLPYEAFRARTNAFDVQIGNSHFQQDQIALDLSDDQGSIYGELTFGTQTGWPVNWLNSGVMGPLGWLPFLECYHGVLSFDHSIEGTLTINGQEIDFTGGRGYIEKDWGRSFPIAYIWHQTNHFEQPETCLTASLAVVPNLGRPFPGFIVGLWHEGQLFDFTTYNRSTVDHVHVNDETVDWVVYNGNYELRMSATRAAGGLLLGPQRTDMIQRVDETLQATVNVELYELLGRRRSLIFSGQGRNAGLEVVGDTNLLVKK